MADGGLATSTQRKLLPDQIVRGIRDVDRGGILGKADVKVLQPRKIHSCSEPLLALMDIEIARTKNIDEDIPHLIGGIGVNDLKPMKFRLGPVIAKQKMP